ncbi:MAG: hypothetical protein CMJ83_21670 [Planctomycetes bacterium]|nr:hypothetical protein [Planctomycetota bacterium]
MQRLLLVLVLAAAADAQTTGSSGTRPDKPAVAPNDPRWHQHLNDIALVYRLWGRLDDEARWAPWLCRGPQPAAARRSRATKDTPHAAKLYTLYASDPKAYGAPTSFRTTPGSDAVEKARKRLAPLKQIIVKEAWKPELMKQPPDPQRSFPAPKSWGASRLKPCQRAGKWYRAQERAGLFVMMKLDPKTPGTDQGWVYGTLTPKGKITASGKIASCMGCHVKAKKDRLFGLPNAPWLPKKKRPAKKGN